jgi:ParB family chromosome partitioning protein
VTRTRIGETVREAVSEEAAQRIADLKKGEMAEAAEQLVAGTGWLPPLLRTVPVTDEAPAIPAYAVAAE